MGGGGEWNSGWPVSKSPWSDSVLGFRWIMFFFWLFWDGPLLVTQSWYPEAALFYFTSSLLSLLLPVCSFRGTLCWIKKKRKEKKITVQVQPTNPGSWQKVQIVRNTEKPQITDFRKCNWQWNTAELHTHRLQVRGRCEASRSLGWNLARTFELTPNTGGGDFQNKTGSTVVKHEKY